MQPEKDGEEWSFLEMELNSEIHNIPFFQAFYNIGSKKCFRRCKMTSRIRNTRRQEKGF